MATASKEKRVVFRSPVQNLRLVRTPTVRKMSDRGEWYQVPGKAYQFTQNGAFGELVVTDKDDIDWLREHHGLNARLDARFVEVGKEPGRVPDSAGIHGQIARALVNGDRKGLADLYVAERHSYSRKDVLDAIAAGIEALGEDKPAPPTPPLHERGYGGDEHGYPEERPAGPHQGARPGESGHEVSEEVEFASPEAEQAAKGREGDLKPGGGSGKNGAYTVGDLKD